MSVTYVHVGIVPDEWVKQGLFKDGLKLNGMGLEVWMGQGCIG